MKNLYLIGVLVYLFIQFSYPYNQYEDNESSNFPKNDFVNFLNAFWKKIGVEKMFKDLKRYLNKKVRAGKRFISLLLL